MSYGYSQQVGNPASIVYAMDIQGEAGIVAAALDDNRFEVWNYESKELIKEWKVKTRTSAVKFVEDRLVLSFVDGSVEIYDMSGYERIAQASTGAGSITQVLPLKKAFAVADDIGNVYVSTSMDSDMALRKFVSVENPVTALAYSPSQNVLVTSQTGILSFWSVSDGKLLSKQNFADSRVMSLAIEEDHNRLMATFSKGLVVVYTTNENDYSLKKVASHKPGNWPVSFDSFTSVMAVGTSGGKIVIYANNASYKTKYPAMINAIRIVPKSAGVITVIVGTHGKGIHVVKASDMKMGK